jgi:hypothetical protein
MDSPFKPRSSLGRWQRPLNAAMAYLLSLTGHKHFRRRQPRNVWKDYFTSACRAGTSTLTPGPMVLEMLIFLR